MSWLYRRTALPIEKAFMARRHDLVCCFIDETIRSGMVVADIGCGNGIYTKIMAAKGAHVHAIDFAEAALDLTRRNLTPKELGNVSLARVNVLDTAIPKVDVALAVGVLPYIKSAATFFQHVMPSTKILLFNYLSRANILNVIRQKFDVLNVRGVHCHGDKEIQNLIQVHECAVSRRHRIATGFLIEARKISAAR
ncbi:MAG: hypothetical protein A3J29_16865 [Acidobacteria bacterium RIFCSPLOWO2_12_FULL_67_14b]|nr:MAG: hypothetical protein A3J29_16865 [Acidobacteria bacterium RIFCSPLOWO2_12_FULL_67_14b]